MILLISNVSLTTGQEVARLTSNSLAGATTLIVDNISGFSIGKYILLGNFGEPNAEIVRIHATTDPAVNTITIAVAKLNNHYADTPVTLLDYNQVEFSRSITLTGAKAVLSTKALSADRLETTYNDLVNSTGYGFFRFKNSSTGVFSIYSAGVSYEGNDYTSIEYVTAEACSLSGVVWGGEYADEDQLIKDANEAQDYITQFGDWSFELVKNDTSITTSTDIDTYSLSSLTYGVKYSGSNQGVLNVKFGDKVLDYITIEEMDKLKEETQVAGTPSMYTVFDGNIILNCPVSSDNDGTILKIKYLKALTRFPDFTSVTEITFPHAISRYIAYKIETRKKNFSDASVFSEEFKEMIAINFNKLKLPTMDQSQYYDFGYNSNSGRILND